MKSQLTNQEALFISMLKAELNENEAVDTQDVKDANDSINKRMGKLLSNKVELNKVMTAIGTKLWLNAQKEKAVNEFLFLAKTQ
jgi:hypothetical protein